MQARTLSFERPIICSLPVRAVSARWTAQAAKSVAALIADTIQRLPDRRPQSARNVIMQKKQVNLRWTVAPALRSAALKEKGGPNAPTAYAASRSVHLRR